ncbi:cytochrome P450 [Pyxidicoccus parkwayensis]|uniref:Cytochrome P450 n=1 Tax=Pyxidicoccus parkwayensis TaxID=2813578 RepID=A0ABX7NZR3_9BACT|nr:cytochrome P450 [Pyxidicoccus parkwaysis]QSQ22972.1 cytochrome P450 [Pyxidicoccus parkwaysis]
MSLPTDVLAATTHPDPYSFYADLVARRPFFWDASLKLWIASSARAVTAVLTHPACRVRPPTEPVPRALGPVASSVFRHLVRMSDGPGHCPMKQAVSAFLGGFDEQRVLEEARRWTRLLGGPEVLYALPFQLPVSVVGSLLGLSEDVLPRVAAWTGDFVRAIAPGAGADRLEAGERAATGLLEVFRAALAAQRASDVPGPLALFARGAERFGMQAVEALLANAIGLLSQTHDATAGLLGNTVLALRARPELLEQSGALSGVVDEVLRYDPPVQNTRRFLAEDAVIEDQRIAAGDTVLVVLAAANRDSALNEDPHRFDVDRKDRRSFTFGAGVHACPGESLAKWMVQGALEELLTIEPGFFRAADFHVSYAPSVNGRIPLFSREVRS